MSTNWLDDTPEEQEVLNRQGAAAQARATTNRGENIFEQKNLPLEKKNRIIFRMLTRKHGEFYKHWYTLPSGAKTADNCACSPDARGNRLVCCPVCQYMEAGFGKPGSGLGYDNTAHNYLLLGLFGDRVTERFKDASGNVSVEETIVWDPEPKIFKSSGTIFDSIWKHNNNPDSPAKGDLVEINWGCWKEPDPGGSKRIFYFAEPHSFGPRPTHGEDADHNQIEIDLGVAALLRDQIITECEPSNADVLSAKISPDPEEASYGTNGGIVSPAAPLVPTDQATSTTVVNDLEMPITGPSTAPKAHPVPTTVPVATKVNQAPTTVNPKDKF